MLPSSSEQAFSAAKTSISNHDLPLDGKTVAVVHPAWSRCGSHRIFASQVNAYKALGAAVVDLAVTDFPGSAEGSTAHSRYFTETMDIAADSRSYAGYSLSQIFTKHFSKAFWQWLHGDYGAMLLEIAQHADIPDIEADLIHCNHFFCMPVAKRIRAKSPCPILLDTHDIQANQYVERARSGWTLKPLARHDRMLSRELAEIGSADLALHLNEQEAAFFKQFLPDISHLTLYPAIQPIKSRDAERGTGTEFLIVASANYPNFFSVRWFLAEVLPRVGDMKIEIAGTVDREFKRRDRRLFEEYSNLFSGEAGTMDAVYRKASHVLLPTVMGEGISVKTIEALSSDLPIIAMPLAFRGMPDDASKLSKVTLVKDPGEFAAAMRQAAMQKVPSALADPQSTSAFYEQTFSPAVYRGKLRDAVLSLSK